MAENRVRISDRVYLDQFSNELIFLTKSGENKERIEPIVVQLLDTLARATGSVVSRQQLISLVWDGNEGVGDKALTKNIYKLRKVFRKNGWKHAIETIPKKGYRLAAGPCKLKRPFPRKTLAIAAAVVLGFIILKIVFPELGHVAQHAMRH